MPCWNSPRDPAAEAPRAHAMTLRVAVAGAITLLDPGLVWLLPRSAPPEQR